MNRFYPGLIKEYGVRAMIGKGGFLQDTVESMKQHGGVYLAIVGGGASGLVAAWRLAIAGVPVEIFESSGRIGGRAG